MHRLFIIALAALCFALPSAAQAKDNHHGHHHRAYHRHHHPYVVFHSYAPVYRPPLVVTYYNVGQPVYPPAYFPPAYYQTDNYQPGQYCREYTKTAYVGGILRQVYGKACLQPDGSWSNFY